MSLVCLPINRIGAVIAGLWPRGAGAVQVSREPRHTTFISFSTSESRASEAGGSALLLPPPFPHSHLVLLAVVSTRSVVVALAQIHPQQFDPVTALAPRYPNPKHPC